MNAPEKIRLTEFSHGGGCGCKIAPAVLTEILASTPIRGLPKELLVGTETADDAAVYRLNDSQALVATTDFFTPIVDDPYDFGRIAATNALSDVYAMGARPIFALAIVGMPLEMLRGSRLSGEVKFAALPVIPEALEWAKQGIATGASERNWKGYGHEVELPAGFPDWKKKLLTDPQTSGGLLVATSAEAQVLEIFKKQGFEARAIGRLSAGPALLTVT